MKLGSIFVKVIKQLRNCQPNFVINIILKFKSSTIITFIALQTFCCILLFYFTDNVIASFTLLCPCIHYIGIPSIHDNMTPFTCPGIANEFQKYAVNTEEGQI